VQVLRAPQNVLRQAQDKFERESWVVEFTLQTRNAVPEHVGDEANLFASKHELTQEMDDLFETVMKRRCVCDFSKNFRFFKSSCLDFPRCVT